MEHRPTAPRRGGGHGGHGSGPDHRTRRHGHGFGGRCGQHEAGGRRWADGEYRLHPRRGVHVDHARLQIGARGGGSGPLAGAPLYILSSDAYGKFGCTTVLENTFQGPTTCTGPESDVVNSVQTDEWPAFTTTGDPVAGPGVNDGLLGSVVRPGIGRQVTYAGHPLYLFEPPSNPFVPVGERFFETVLPLPPWHGLWTLVDSISGIPTPGAATVGSETLPTVGRRWPPRSTPTPSPEAWR